MDEHSDSVRQSLAVLSGEQRRLGEVGMRLCKAADGRLYTIDLLAIAALNRAAALTAGFGMLMEKRNHLCAAALLRLQLDNALRMSALWRVENKAQAASKILRGTPVKHLKDKVGKKLTDKVLVEYFAGSKDWVARVYDRTSGYIHFSEAHIASSLTPSPNDPEQFQFKVSAEDEGIPDEIYEETIAAFVASTDLFLEYIELWVKEKSSFSFPAEGLDEIGRAGKPAGNDLSA